MKRNKLSTLAAALMASLFASPLMAQSVDPLLEQSSLFGIGHSSGKLWRYDFPTDKINMVHNIRFVDTGATPSGIQASAYFPGFQQIHAFWKDPADGLSKVMHVDTESAEAILTGVNLGKGTVVGAVAVVSKGLINNSDGTQSEADQFQVYLLQDNPEPEYPPAVLGQINLNPKNNNTFEFELTLADGTILDRDDLKNGNVTVDEFGVAYNDVSPRLLIRPQGNGNQNAININGEPHQFDNGSQLIVDSSTMNVKLFNSKINNGKAMGDWWVEIEAESATVTIDGTVVLSPPEPWVPTSRLAALHTKTGLATTIMQLDNLYEGGLATRDGETFFATRGNDLWKIVPATKSETLVGSLGTSNNLGLEFVGTTMMVFEVVGDKLYPYDATTGAPLGAGANLAGINDLGTITFMPTSEIPKKVRVAFD